MDREEQTQGLESSLIPTAQKNVFESRKRLNKDEIFTEVKKQLMLAGPLVSVNLLLNCLQVISVMFVGHLGELALSGASMATSFASVTGFSFLASLLFLLNIAWYVVL
uniref:Uncharacterized protein n=1 Tax=Davidia involucrata TaxID=16924 RepID=A0A5B6ZP98_DAVIN